MQTSFCSELAEERNCSPLLIRVIVIDCLSRLHELAVKQGLGRSIKECRFEFGERATWHLGGLLESASDQNSGYWAEHLERLDPSLKRYAIIMERWRFELDRELSAKS